MTIPIEDQPRYVIDEEYKPREETQILPEVQHRALEKLMKVSGTMLNEEERDVLYRLRDKLRQDTERVRTLKKVTVADKPLDEYLIRYREQSSNNKAQKNPESKNNGEEPDSPPQPKVTHVIGFRPDEVVRRYIECWNQQKFGAEFECFSRDFMKTDREAYLEARHNYYHTQLGQGGLKINFKGIETCNIYGGEADVTALKVIALGNRKPKEERDLYRLKLETGRWTICGVEPLGQ